MIIRRTHVQERLIQRFGMDLSNNEIREVVCLIQQCKSICIGRASRRRSTHILRYKNRVLKVVYSLKSKSLVTALPFDPDKDSIYVEQLDSLLRENFSKEFNYICEIELNKYFKLGIYKSYSYDPVKISVYKLRLNGEFLVAKPNLEEIYEFIKINIKNDFDEANSKIDRITHIGILQTIKQNREIYENF